MIQVRGEKRGKGGAAMGRGLEGDRVEEKDFYRVSARVS